MSLGLVQRLDSDLDLVVGDAAVFHLRRHDRFMLANAAARGMKVRKASQQCLVVLACALFAFAEAVNSVDHVGVLLGRRVGEPYIRLVPVRELFRIEDGTLLEARRTGGGFRGSFRGSALV